MTKHMFIIPLMALSIAGATDPASRHERPDERLQIRKAGQAFQTSISRPHAGRGEERSQQDDGLSGLHVERARFA